MLAEICDSHYSTDFDAPCEGGTIRPGRPPEDDFNPVADVLRQMAHAIDFSDPLPELDDLPPIPAEVRELVIDRIDAAYREGLITLDCDNYAALLMAIMPDDFTIPSAPATATDSAPQSDDRIEVYAARVKLAVHLYHQADAQPLSETRGVMVRKAGGSHPKVLGWQDDKHNCE